MFRREGRFRSPYDNKTDVESITLSTSVCLSVITFDESYRPVTVPDTGFTLQSTVLSTV